MIIKSFILLTIISIYYPKNELLASWTDDQVKQELQTHKTEIEQVRTEINVQGDRYSFPLSLAMAKWASKKARNTTSATEQKKYASLAREILNEARGFGWQNRAPTSKEGACMASTSVDIALATNDNIDTLWDGMPRTAGKANTLHYDYLKRAAIAARFIGSKSEYLTESGLITWARLPGVRNSLVDPLEMERPETIRAFLTPTRTLETVVKTGPDWRSNPSPNGWELPEDTKETLRIADMVIQTKNPAWPTRDNSPATLASVRNTYAELLRLGTNVSEDLQSSGNTSEASRRGYATLRITRLIPLFSLLDPQNYNLTLPPQDGFNRDRLNVANITIESAIFQWSQKASIPAFRNDLKNTSSLLDKMDPIIKRGGFGGQGVHQLDNFQIKHTREMLELGRKYFSGHYIPRKTKAELTKDIDQRLTTLGTNLTAHYDGNALNKSQIMDHLGYILNGYPTGFTGTIESESSNDKITEAEWVEILSMIFDFSQKLDTFCLNTGIDQTPFNLESNFYSQLFENQHTRGGCIPGRKDRILYRLANLLRQWMNFGYRLA